MSFRTDTGRPQRYRSGRRSLAGLPAWPWQRRSEEAEEVPDFTGEPDPSREPVPTELRMRYAHRHLIVTADGLWAFYLLDGVDWPMQTPAAREAVIEDQMFRLADLIGKRIWIRGLSNPFPHQAFAKRLYDDNPHRLPDVMSGSGSPSARTFADLVDAAQRHTIGLDARRPVAILGVLVSTYVVRPEHLPKLLSSAPIAENLGEIARVRRALTEVTAAVGRAGFGGRPLSAKALRWVTHASVGLGTPVPSALLHGDTKGWTGDDVPGFTNPVYPTEAPYAPTTVLRTMRESVQHTRHVAVLHADTFEERRTDNPDLLPFLAWTQTLDHLVEYCAVFDVLDGRSLKGGAELDRRRAKNIAAHHEEHDDDPPARVLRGIERAREVEDEVANASREVAARLRGVVMLAVTGADEETTLQIAADVTVAAAQEQGMHLAHDYGQYDYYRAFIPGELCPMSGHITQMPAYFLASGVPNATSAAGDPTGFLLGSIAGSHDVFVFDTHGGARRNKSNLVVTGGDPGCGKSSLGGALADWCATRGIRTVGYDPSGPWARLCDLPHLRGNARHLSLTGGYQGILVPHLMVLDPRAEDYDDASQYAAALAEARAERMELAIDSFRDLLPYTMVTGDRTGAIQGTIESAVTDVGGEYGTDPWAIVDRLDRSGETGRMIADRLRARGQLKDGALVFPAAHRDVDDEPGRRLVEQAALTVITMEGLTLPPKDQPDRSLWSRQALASVPILNLGSRFAMRTIYADRKPKAVLLDELGISTGGAGSFSSFAVRSAFDSRKWNALVGLIFQNPNTLMNLDAQISNLAGAAFIGRMDETAARAGLPLLRLRDDSGYHHAITRLEPGEFLVRDWHSRVRKVRVDRDWWHPDLRAALDTTPGGEGSYVEDAGDEIFTGVA